MRPWSVVSLAPWYAFAVRGVVRVELVRCLYIGICSCCSYYIVVRSWLYCVPALVVLLPHCSQWPPPGPRGYPQVARYPTLRRGGSFSKRGEGLTETKPVLIFMREVKKNVVFQCKMGKTGRKFWRVEGVKEKVEKVKERRKRKSRSRDRRI